MGWQARVSWQAAPATRPAVFPTVPPPRPELIPSPSKWRPQVSGRLAFQRVSFFTSSSVIEAGLLL